MSEDCSDSGTQESRTEQDDQEVQYNNYSATYACVYEKYSMKGVSQGKYSTRQSRVLYWPLDTHPHAVFFIHTHRGALTITYTTLYHRVIPHW